MDADQRGRERDRLATPADLDPRADAGVGAREVVDHDRHPSRCGRRRGTSWSARARGRRRRSRRAPRCSIHATGTTCGVPSWPPTVAIAPSWRAAHQVRDARPSGEDAHRAADQERRRARGRPAQQYAVAHSGGAELRPVACRGPARSARPCVGRQPSRVDAGDRPASSRRAIRWSPPAARRPSRRGGRAGSRRRRPRPRRG